MADPIELNGAQEAGNGAYALRDLRLGFGRTPVDDRLFALGYPHMITPIERTVNLSKATPKKLFRLSGELARGGWPAAVIAPFAAHWKQWMKGDPTPVDLTARVPSVDELMDLIVTTSSTIVYAAVYLAEALHGSSAVAEGLIERMEGFAPQEWEKSSFATFGREIVGPLGFVVRRCTSEQYRSLQARLSPLCDRAQEHGPFAHVSKRIDVVVHGRAGIERRGYRPNGKDLGTADLIYAHDSPEWLRPILLARLTEQTSRDWPVIDARLAFLGGDEAIELMCDVSKWRSQDRKQIVEQMGRINHPAVRTMISELSQLAGAKTLAKAWLRSNPE